MTDSERKTNMSSEYFFKCNKCQETGGVYTRQAWGWGNFYVIETFKFLAYHTDKCGAEYICVVTEDEIDPKIYNLQNRIDFLKKTKDYFPCFETEFIGKDINKIEEARNAWYEHEMEATMKSLEFEKSMTTEVLVLRTDFSDENMWEVICKEIKTPNNEFEFIPYVKLLSDRKFDGFQNDQIFSFIANGYKPSFIFIVDHKAMSNVEHPILCINLKAEQGQHFRVIPSSMWEVENNLSISNMDFREFADSVDKDGIFRGFD